MNGRSIQLCYLFSRIKFLELSYVLFTRFFQQFHKVFPPTFYNHVGPVTYCLVGDWNDHCFCVTIRNVLDFFLQDAKLRRIDLVLEIVK